MQYVKLKIRHQPRIIFAQPWHFHIFKPERRLLPFCSHFPKRLTATCLFVFSFVKRWAARVKKRLKKIFTENFVRKSRLRCDWRWILDFFLRLLSDGFKIFAYFPSHRLCTFTLTLSHSLPYAHAADKLPFVCESIEYVTLTLLLDTFQLFALRLSPMYLNFASFIHVLTRIDLQSIETAKLANFTC